MEDFIKNVPIFKSLTDEEFRLIHQFLIPFSVLGGSTIYSHGDEADGMYIVEKGFVNMTKTDLKGVDHIVKSVGSGGTFGELALFDDKPRILQATATHPTKGYLLPKASFRNLIAISDKTLILKLQKGLCENYHRTLLGLFHFAANSSVNGSKRSDQECEISQSCLSDHTLNYHLLKQLRCFQAYDSEEFNTLIAQMPLWEVPKGYVLYDNNHQTSSCFFVVRGAVRLMIKTEGKLVQKGVLCPGSMIRACTKTAILQPNAAYVTSERSQILEMKWDQFEKILQEESLLSWKMLTSYNESLIKLIRMLFIPMPAPGPNPLF